MFELKKHSDRIDIDLLEKIVTEFCEKNPTVEVKSIDRINYQLLIGREGINFGIDPKTPSTLDFSSKNSTDLSLKLLQKLSEDLRTTIYLIKFGDRFMKIDPKDLKLSHFIA